MPTDRSRKATPGFLVPDARWTTGIIDDSTSAYTEAGPRPGVPEPSPSTGTALIPGAVDGTHSRMVLGGRGEMVSGVAYDLLLSAGGAPVADGGARLLWKNSTDGDSRWRGHDLPCSVQSWRALDYTALSPAWTELPATTLRDGTVLVAAVYTGSEIHVWESTDYGDTFTDNTVVTGSWSGRACPTVCELSDGRAVLVYWVEGTDCVQLRSSIRSPNGYGWADGERALLRSTIDTTLYTPMRLRVASNGDDVLLVGWFSALFGSPFSDVLFQWGSADDATSFSQVDQWTGADSDKMGAYVDVVVQDGRYGVFYLRETAPSSGDAVPYVRWLGSAFTALSSSGATLGTAPTTGDSMRWGSLSSGAFTTGDLAAIADDAGALYVFGRDVLDDSVGHVRGSFDGGATWQSFGAGPAAGSGVPWLRSGVSDTYSHSFCATWAGGRVVLPHKFTGGGVDRFSLCVAALGGWTSIEQPRTSETSTWSDRTGAVETWVPFDLPDGGNWTLATSGSPTITLDTSSGSLKVVQTGTDHATWYLTTPPSGSISDGLDVVWTVRTQAGNTGTASLVVRIGDGGAKSYTVGVTVSTTAITLKDNVASTTIDSVSVDSTVDHVQVRAAMRNGHASPGDDGTVKCWYRTAGTTDGKWQSVGSSTALVHGSSTTNYVGWGTSAGAGTFYFRGPVSWTSDTYVGLGVVRETNPDDLVGRPVSATGAYVDQGYLLFASSGPGRRGDAWTAEPICDYPVSSVFPGTSPSPASPWRSEDDAADVVLVFDVASPTASRLAGKVLGFHLGDINFRYFLLEGKKTSGAWETIIDADTATGMSGLTYVREGDSFHPDTGTAPTPYFTYNALAGSRVQWGSGPYTALISDNGAGVWADTSAGTLQAVIVADEAAALSDASGSDLAIIPKDVTVVAPNPSAYSSYRLTIPAQTTLEGFLQVGVALLGAIHLPAVPYSATRQVGASSLTELTTAKNGSRRARAWNSPRDTVTLGWEEGVPTRGLYTSPATPDITRAYSGGNAVAAVGDSADNLLGMFRRLQGASELLVYLESVPFQQTSDAFLVNTPGSTLYGRVTSTDVALDTVRGNERQSEVRRAARVTIEQEK